MADLIQLRRDTKANWDAVSGSVILADGEVGIICDQSPLQCKVGDGVSYWNQLETQAWAEPGLSGSINQRINQVSGSLHTEVSTLSGSLESLEDNIGHYTCTTAGGTAAKVISAADAPNYTRITGGSLKIKFNSKNTAASGVTLKVGNAAAANLYYDGAPVTNLNTWEAGETVDVYFDGQYYMANNVSGGGTFATGQKVKNVSIGNVPGTSQTTLMSQKGATDLTSEYNVSANNSNTEYTFAQAVVLIPVSLQKGGLTIKYIDSATHEYTIKCLMSSTWSTVESNWQGVGEGLIDTTHLTNPTDKSLAKAEDVVPIKGAVRELNYSEIKSNQTPIDGYCVQGSSGDLVSSSTTAYVEIDVSTVDKVRFSELIVITTGYTSGFSFGHYDNGVYVNDYSRAWTRDTSSGASHNYIIDTVLDVPENSTIFRCTSKTSALNETTFYCYLINGSGAISKDYVDSYLFDKNITNDINIPKSNSEFTLSIQNNTWLGQHSITNAGNVYIIDLSFYPGASKIKISKNTLKSFFFISRKKLPTTIPNEGINYTTLNSEYAAQCQIPNGGSEYRTQVSSENLTLTVNLSSDAKYVYIGRHYTEGGITSNYTPSSIVVSTQKITGGILGELSLNPVSSNNKQLSLGIDKNLNSTVLEFNKDYVDNVVVYEGLTLTDIFEKNNLIPIYPGFDNGEYSPMRVGNGNPQITSTEYVTGNCSLCVNDIDTTSSQLRYPVTGNFYSSNIPYFAAFKVKVISYTQGKIGINIGSNDTAQLFIQRTTDGWETVSGDLTSGNSALFLGGFTSSKLVGYIDNPVLVSKSLFKTIPTVEQFTNLYEQYISYKMSSKNVSVNINKIQRYTDSDCLIRFVQEMNARASRIGMSSNTIFTSASGLDTTLNSNRSTARDYIKLMIEAMSHPYLMKVWGKPSWNFKYLDATDNLWKTKALESTVCNPNHQSDMPELLATYNILGGKTGTIGAGELLPSGRYYHNYCVVAEKNGKYVIAVLFGGDYSGSTYGDKRYAKMKILLDNAFGLLNDSSYQTQTVLDKPSVDYKCSCAACEVPKILPSMLQNFTPTILYSENLDLQIYIASTTKIMTCLLAEELIPINQKLLYKASDDIGGSGDDLDAGDIASFEEMMMDTMLPSSNGCAQCIGRLAGRYLLEFENGKEL